MSNLLRLLTDRMGRSATSSQAAHIAWLEAESKRLQHEGDELRQANARLQAEGDQLRQANQGLQAEVARLRQRVAELERSGKRQATPFARDKRTQEPKKPGRRPGKGEFSHRAKPRLDQVDTTQAMRLDGCPHCGSEVVDVQEHEHFEIEIPPVQPIITRYVTESGYCPHCQARVQTCHDQQISQATGAAGVVVGPRAKALAADLKHRLGLSYAKVSELMRVAFQLEVTRSGWCQADQRLAEQARPLYEQLVELVRQSAVVHGDETGWRIGALSAWLWVFTAQDVTVYTIADNRSHAVIVEMLGRRFEGVLVSDCFTAYDHHALADWLKQKCLAHLLKDLSQLEASKTRGAVRFARDVAQLLREALALQQQRATLDPEHYRHSCLQLESRLDALIDERRRLSDPDNQRLAKRLRKHRPHLLRFLYTEGLDATNNQAERMLRPAVITRKTGGCNRTDTGADTHAILSSILATCKQRSIPIVDFLVELQRHGAVDPLFEPP